MIAVFLDGAPHGTAAVLQVFATAESLTDAVAADLYRLTPIPGLTPERFLLALHQSDLVEPRNSEWSFPHKTREELRHLTYAEVATVRQAHEVLLARGLEAAPAESGSIIPSYLLTDAGRAYHTAYAGDVARALELYDGVAERMSQLSIGLDGVQWLASRFAEEQQRARVLPGDDTRLLFLRAMAIWREGPRKAAAPLFSRIVAKNEVNQYTEIACDILGVGVVGKDRAIAARLFRQAVGIAREIGNRDGEGVHLHNLARTQIWSNPSRSEELYRASVAIAEERGDGFSAAIRKNGLGDLLAHRGAKRRPEAEQLLREAIGYFNEQGDDASMGAPLTTLARVVAMDSTRIDEAEELYRQAIRIAYDNGDATGMSLRTYGLGRLLARLPGREQEAAQLLQEWETLPGSAGDYRRAGAVQRLLEKLRFGYPTAERRWR